LALDFFISRTSCLKVLSYYTALVLFSQVISEEKLKKAYFLLLILEKVLFFQEKCSIKTFLLKKG